MDKLEYQIEMKWTGNQGKGTEDYRSYERSFTLSAEGNQDLQCSADPNYLGDASKWNPEELLLGSLSSCHMLWYLHLCTVNKIIVQEYDDFPTAELTFDANKVGKFTSATLKPKITLSSSDKLETARKLHEEAHQKCYVSNSVSFPVRIEPEYHVAGE